MAWLQLTLVCDRGTAEKLSGLLEQFDAMSVSFSAVSGECLLAEGNVIPEGYWEHTRISALLQTDTDLDILLACLRNCAGPDQIRDHHFEIVEDRDWIGEVEQACQPLVFGDRLCICPGWCVPPDHIQHLIMLDPGLAFGTGKHDTTAMCLEWLVQHDVCNRTVIDYGCGSGVLALAAAALGARRVYAVDIDPQALQAAQANAERNRMEDRITVGHNDGITLPAADILLANILLGPLLQSAPDFAGLLAGGGDLVMSGLVSVQVEECLAAYRTWFTMSLPWYRNEWALLHGMRRHDR